MTGPLTISKNGDGKSEESLKMELQEPTEYKTHIEKHEETENDEDMLYIDNFGHHKKKEPRVGPSFNVDEVPLITDIQDFEYM